MIHHMTSISHAVGEFLRTGELRLLVIVLGLRHVCKFLVGNNNRQRQGVKQTRAKSKMRKGWKISFCKHDFSSCSHKSHKKCLRSVTREGEKERSPIFIFKIVSKLNHNFIFFVSSKRLREKEEKMSAIGVMNGECLSAHLPHTTHRTTRK